MSDIIERYKNSLHLESAQLVEQDLLDPEQTAAKVQEHGISIFPGLLSKETLQGLNDEFDQMLDPAHRASLGFTVDEIDNLINIRLILDRLSPQQFPETYGFFTSTWMRDVATAFYGENNFRLNDEIFVSNLFESHGTQSMPPFALHFDKRQVLKFFIYLTDTTEDNGAMRATPGTHLINRERRTQAMRLGSLESIKNVIPEPDVPSIPVVGPAGTLFVFDTDMCHGASHVKAGHTRRTMRGHTHSLDMLRAIAREGHGTLVQQN